MIDEEATKLLETARADGISRFVVGAVVMRHQTILLLRRMPSDFMGGIYELPSGQVEPGESLGEALLRELKEETGLELARREQYVGSIDYFSKSGEPTRQFNFLATVKEHSGIRLTEHDDYVWVSITHLEQIPMSKETRSTVRACLS